MSSRQSSFSSGNNWYIATDAIKYLREGLVLFVDESIKLQHDQIMSNIGSQRCNYCRIATLLPNHAYQQNKMSPSKVCQFGQKECPCLEEKSMFKRRCPRNVCGQIYDEILTLYYFSPPTPCWKNTIISKWSEDPWEYAKCFISFPGFEKKVGPKDIDCTGLLHIMINNKGLHQYLNQRITGNDIYCRVRRHIEAIYRNPSHEIEIESLYEYLRDMKAVLLDKKTLGKREECRQAAWNIEQLVAADEEYAESETYEEDFAYTEKILYDSRYEIEFIHEGKIGEGAYGVVFRATKKMETHPYAVKRIGLPGRTDPNGKVMGEVQALVKLDHPNIVRYFNSWIENPPEGWQEERDATNEISEMSLSPSSSSASRSGSSTGRPKSYLYIQMQLCRMTLSTWLEDNLEREKKTVLKWFKKITDAIRYVHEKGLVHRDLKPSNIFFTDDGIIKVGDFGLAKALSENQEVLFYTDEGTYFYRSPEVVKARGKVGSAKVDIFSMGVILFEMLQPFESKMERAKVLEGVREHRFPDDFSEHMPKEKKLIDRMMEEKSAKRPSASEVLRMLPELQT